jgi:hypothetical protein
MHTYSRKDCKLVIQAKNLPFQIVKLGGMFRLRVNFSDKTVAIKSWDDLYAEISEIPDPLVDRDVLVPAGVEVRDPKTMTDADFAPAAS